MARRGQPQTRARRAAPHDRRRGRRRRKVAPYHRLQGAFDGIAAAAGVGAASFEQLVLAAALVSRRRARKATSVDAD